jgi:outer membrane protein assembly factor BamD
MKSILIKKILKSAFILSLALFLVSCAETYLPEKAFKGQSAQKILKGGEKALAKNNYNNAIRNFEALDALYPFSNEAEQGQLNVIYAYYKNDDYTSALAAADRYIHLYPRSPKVPYVYYMKGMINFESGQSWIQKLYNKDLAELDLKHLREAFANFNELIREFPNSIYVKDAHERMIFIRNTLAEYEIKIAKFYFRHKAYVAAVNRASYVVKHFEGSPEVEDALIIMIKSYQKLGATSEVTETKLLLKSNYPHAKIQEFEI